MAAPGSARILQQDFSAGMYRSGSQELMPANSFFDGTNTLLDGLGSPYARGGSSYRSNGAYGAGLRFIWDGWLANGQNTLIGAPSGGYARLNGDGSVTVLGGEATLTPGRAASINGLLYLPGGNTYDGTSFGYAGAYHYWAVVANRLLRVGSNGRRVEFSEVNKPSSFLATDYHELPGGVEILGLEGSRDAAVVFTTGGVWIISGMSSNLTDANGNVQHHLDHYSGDLVLWGDAGIAAWEGALVVPGTDAVWLIRRGVTSEQVQSFERISDSISDLYQSYVKAGYRPGQATVYRNHYLLPVLAAGRVVDVLVCRLDIGGRKPPWTRFSGYGAEVGALTTRVTAGAARQPELLGATFGGDSRVLTLGYFDPGSGAIYDADGSVPAWSLETRSIPTGNQVPNLASRLRLRYQLSAPTGASPSIAAAFAAEGVPKGVPTWGSGITWGAFSWATPGAYSYEPLDGVAPVSADATTAHSWRFARKRRFVRLRFTCSEPRLQLNVRALELFVRQEGRL